MIKKIKITIGPKMNRLIPKLSIVWSKKRRRMRKRDRLAEYAERDSKIRQSFTNISGSIIGNEITYGE